MNSVVKKILSLLLSALIAVSCFVAASAADVMYGDADGNGEVNSSDALSVLLHSIGQVLLTGDRFVAADVNGDGSVNSSDALEILFYSVGKIDSFSVEYVVAVPKTDKEILDTYAAAVKKVRDEMPTYKIVTSNTAKDIKTDVSDPLHLLALSGEITAKELEEEFKNEMIAQNSTQTTVCKKENSLYFAYLPPECTLTDASLLASASASVLSNGNLKIELRFKDETNPKAGSPLGKVLGVADYDEALAELKQSSEFEDMEDMEGMIDTSLNKLIYKNCYVICEIDRTTGDMVNLEWNTDMYTDTSITMLVISVDAEMTMCINSAFEFGKETL